MFVIEGEGIGVDITYFSRDIDRRETVVAFEFGLVRLDHQ